jgi:hypothetical protein
MSFSDSNEKARGMFEHLNLSSYNTDKIGNRYLDWYERELNTLGRASKVLELGVKNGGSVLLWRDVFSEGEIVGIDKNLGNLDPGVQGVSRLHLYEGSQADQKFLTDVSQKHAPQGFDLIVDDASHVGWLSRASFDILFDRFLRKGGIYVVEDWTTGYWSDWSDGCTFRPRGPLRNAGWNLLKSLRICKSPPVDQALSGLVGFVKSLVDEQGAPDLTRQLHNRPHGRKSRFARMVFYDSVLFIHKRSD